MDVMDTTGNGSKTKKSSGKKSARRQKKPQQALVPITIDVQRFADELALVLQKYIPHDLVCVNCGHKNAIPFAIVPELFALGNTNLFKVISTQIGIEGITGGKSWAGQPITYNLLCMDCIDEVVERAKVGLAMTVLLKRVSQGGEA